MTGRAGGMNRNELPKAQPPSGRFDNRMPAERFQEWIDHCKSLLPPPSQPDPPQRRQVLIDPTPAAEPDPFAELDAPPATESEEPF